MTLAKDILNDKGDAPCHCAALARSAVTPEFFRLQRPSRALPHRVCISGLSLLYIYIYIDVHACIFMSVHICLQNGFVYTYFCKHMRSCVQSAQKDSQYLFLFLDEGHCLPSLEVQAVCDRSPLSKGRSYSSLAPRVSTGCFGVLFRIDRKKFRSHAQELGVRFCMAL